VHALSLESCDDVSIVTCCPRWIGLATIDNHNYWDQVRLDVNRAYNFFPEGTASPFTPHSAASGGKSSLMVSPSFSSF